MAGKNPITIETLEILDAIERRGSFAKAAEELNKATSAVSYRIQQLEEQLETALFQRQGRRSVLTPAGRLVLEEGRKILATSARLASAARELASGWETRIRIAVESTQHYPAFFEAAAQFLEDHANVELDISESVLNGGWEALEQGRVELLVGAPGPVPQQKGFRAVSLGHSDLVPVIARQHPLAHLADDPDHIAAALPQLRRVITHDTSQVEIARSEGLSSGGQHCYVQNVDQKVAAIRAGIGVGHLPRRRVQSYLDDGTLRELPIDRKPPPDTFLAWKISNRGKGLQAMIRLLGEARW